MSIINIDLSDTVASWRNKTNQLAVNVGDLALLTTLVDSNIVAAINYLDSSIGLVGTINTTVNNLTTSVNNLDSSVGTLASLNTTDKSSLVAAINEVNIQPNISVTDAGGDGSLSYNNTTGVLTYTGPSAVETRAHFSINDAGGDGSLSYDSATGVFTYTGPSASEVRAHFSAGTGINIASGVISSTLGTDITSSEFASATTLLIKDSSGSTLKTLYSPGS